VSGNTLASAFDPATLAHALSLFALLCARLAPLCWVAPFVALSTAPNAISVALLFVLALCLWPVAHASAVLGPVALPALLALCLREALLGLTYALALALPLRAIEWGARIAGQASTLPGAAASLGSLHALSAVAAFFVLGGQRVALAALAHELTRRPLGALATTPDLGALALSSARLVGDAFGLAVLLALPVAAALALAELGVALALRSTPALAAAFAPLKAALALALFALAALVTLAALPDTLAHALRAAQSSLGGP
jgi:type III secretory pathway component EscT